MPTTIYMPTPEPTTIYMPTPAPTADGEDASWDACWDCRFCFDCALLVANVTKKAPAGAVGAELLFGPYYQQVDVVGLEQPTPLALGGMLTCGALKLKDPTLLSARVPRQGPYCGRLRPTG